MPGHVSYPSQEKEVSNLALDILKSEGLVFNQIHNILAGVPPENVIALFEAAELYGQY